MHISGAPDAFDEVMKMTNFSWLWHAELAWYTSHAACQIGLYGFEYVLDLPDLAWLLGFLQPEWNFLNRLFTLL